MDFLCKVCDREILENESERTYYVATLRKRYERCLYTKHTNNNNNLDEFDRILNQYISHHNRKFDLYLYKLTFSLEFSNNSFQVIKTNYRLIKDDNHMKSLFLRCSEYFTLIGYKFCNINHITIDSINDRCNMTYENYINQPTQGIELKINMVIAKNPQLINSLDRNKNHFLIRKSSQLPFNNKKCR